MEIRAFEARKLTESGASGVSRFEPRCVGSDGREQPKPAPQKQAAPAPAPAPPAPTVDLVKERKQAFQEGFQAGAEAAEKSARETYEKALAGLRGAATAFEQARPALLADAQEELVELAFAIARRVLRREIGVDPQATRAIAAACMAEAGGAAIKKIWVHPEDVASVREGVGPGIEVEGDRSMSRGGAVIETERGKLDGSIEAQLDEIAKGLADA